MAYLRYDGPSDGDVCRSAIFVNCDSGKIGGARDAYRMRSERGATAVEYAAMLGLIAAVIVLAISFLGGTASSTFSCVGQATGGNTCVQAVQLVTPVTTVTPAPSHSCTSHNKSPGKGCFGK
jgi:pilus assembly protein Flp/PilA